MNESVVNKPNCRVYFYFAKENDRKGSYRTYQNKNHSKVVVIDLS